MNGPWHLEWNAGKRWATVSYAGIFRDLSRALEVFRLLVGVNGAWIAFRVVDSEGERLVEIQPGRAA